MNNYYITGTSSGIGKAIAEELLLNDRNKVIGLSRKCAISHPNYHHIFIDLSDIPAVINFHFQEHTDADKIVLVNNAGLLGDIGHIGNITGDKINKTFQVNVIALAVLSNNFVKTYQRQSCQKIILNVSSGAGKFPVDGWAAYCASKAAIDMLSVVIKEEQDLIEDESKRVKIFSVAPGKVDTSMQAEIRKASQGGFSKVQYFIDAKSKNELLNPKQVAKQYVQLLEQVTGVDEVVFSLKDFSATKS